MSNKTDATNSEGVSLSSLPVFQLGKDQTEAMLHLQKKVLNAYEDAGRAWLARVRSELELWSDLTSKLTASHTMPDCVNAYRDCLSQRMQMTAEDGRHVFEDGQKIMSVFTHGLSDSWTKERKSRELK